MKAATMRRSRPRRRLGSRPPRRRRTPPARAADGEGLGAARSHRILVAFVSEDWRFAW